MAYINFKEERFKANNQLEKRKVNNKKLKEKLISHKDLISTQYETKYSFRLIENRTINNGETLKEDEFLEITNKNIACTDFINCKFYNIKFINCSFIACTFNHCDFGGGGVVFQDCSFIKAESDSTPSLNIKDNLSCEFHNCNLYAKFLNSNIAYLIIENSELQNTSFEYTDMTAIIIKNSTLKKTNFIDSNLCDAKTLNCYIEDLEFNDKNKSKLDEKTFFDKIELRKHTREEYEGIYMVYETLANKFKENNLKNNFGEYYYLCKTIQRKVLNPLSKTISYLSWFTCGYGERIVAPVISSLIIILIFAIVYLIIGIKIEEQVFMITYNTIASIDFKTFISLLNESITLSVGMFAGVGMVNAMPTEFSYIFCNAEMLIGVVMMGIGIGTITRKIIR